MRKEEEKKGAPAGTVKTIIRTQAVTTVSLVSDRSRNFGEGLEAIPVISDKEFVSILFRP